MLKQKKPTVGLRSPIAGQYFMKKLITIRKQAYSNILKILPSKIEKKSDKNSYIFHISAQNINCGYSLEPPIYVFEQK